MKHLFLLLPFLVAWTCSGGTQTASSCPVAAERLCEAGTPDVSCADLGALWTAGTASCRADCSGYDISGCSVHQDVAKSAWEVVRPNERIGKSPEPPDSSAEALCNQPNQDGKQGADFAVHRADATSQDWVIYLEGGNHCASQKDCEGRKEDLVQPWAAADRDLVKLGDVETGMHGVLYNKAAGNPFSYGDNKAFANYCSSDFWSAGAVSHKTMTNGDWPFRGGVNALNMIRTLKQRYGLDDADPATRVMLVGGSAGAMGVHAIAHQVAAHLPNTVSHQGLFVIVDGGYVPFDWVNPTTQLNGDKDVLTPAWAYWTSLTKPLLHPACMAAHAGVEGACYGGQAALPHLAHGGSGAPALPTLVITHELDTTQGQFGGIVEKVPDTDPQLYTVSNPVKANEWTQEMRDVLWDPSNSLHTPEAWVWSTCGLMTSSGEGAHVQIQKADWAGNTLPVAGSTCVTASPTTITLPEMVNCFVEGQSSSPMRLAQSPCPVWPP